MHLDLSALADQEELAFLTQELQVRTNQQRSPHLPSCQMVASHPEDAWRVMTRLEFEASARACCASTGLSEIIHNAILAQKLLDLDRPVSPAELDGLLPDFVEKGGAGADLFAPQLRAHISQLGERSREWYASSAPLEALEQLASLAAVVETNLLDTMVRALGWDGWCVADPNHTTRIGDRALEHYRDRVRPSGMVLVARNRGRYDLGYALTFHLGLSHAVDQHAFEGQVAALPASLTPLIEWASSEDPEISHCPLDPSDGPDVVEIAARFFLDGLATTAEHSLTLARAI